MKGFLVTQASYINRDPTGMNHCVLGLASCWWQNELSGNKRGLILGTSIEPVKGINYSPKTATQQ